MNVWLVHQGELLPIDGDVRPFRYNMLSQHLRNGGHEVIRWAPTFAHATKTQRTKTNQTIVLGENFEIELLYTTGYRRHVGVKRLLAHVQFAGGFLKIAPKRKPPDLILVSLPTPSLCAAVVYYANQRRIPVVIDVRDCWPDVLDKLVASHWSRIPLRVLSSPMRMLNSYSFPRASAVFGVSKSFLNWGLAQANRGRTRFDACFMIGYQPVEVNSEEHSAAAHKWNERGVSESDRVVCFFGSFSRQYDFETILRVADMLPEWRFVLCGDGERFDEVAQRAEGLENVFLPGWVGNAEIEVLAEWSSAGLAPYARESGVSIGNKPFEYMAAGLPIISSHSGELAEILAKEGCGWTYGPSDVEALRTILSRLTTQPQLQEHVSRRATKAFNTQYSADVIYPSMTEQLELIANATSRSE